MPGVWRGCVVPAEVRLTFLGGVCAFWNACAVALGVAKVCGPADSVQSRLVLYV